MQYKPSHFKEIIMQNLTPPNCDLTLQIDPLESENGVAKGRWNIDDKFINGNGVVMGGFQSAITDTMMAYAIASLLEDHQTFASIDLHTTFHRPVIEGIAKVEAVVEKKGRRTAYVTAEIFQNEKKCASSVSSILIMDDE